MWTTCRTYRLLVVAVLMAGLLIQTGCQSSAYLRQRGIEAYEVGRLDEADAYFTRAYGQYPSDWKSMYYVSLIRLRQNEPFKAQILLEQVRQIRYDKEQRSDIVDALAEAFYQQDKRQRLHALLKTESAGGGSPWAYLRQAHYLAQVGDVDGADVAYRKAAHFASKGDVQPWLASADFYESIGDDMSAVETLKHAYQINPNDGIVLRRLRDSGWAPAPVATTIQNDND